MFTVAELRLIRANMTSLGYVRELSVEEDKLLEKINKLIVRVHFNKRRSDA
jgi:hypothetical protein